MGAHFAESTVLRVAHAVEASSGFTPVPPMVAALGD
jgi:Asp-tRNA(Asn)/Glu-tRNA(Gln) amidotransferase A subunit family amidase